MSDENVPGHGGAPDPVPGSMFRPTLADMFPGAIDTPVQPPAAEGEAAREQLPQASGQAEADSPAEVTP